MQRISLPQDSRTASQVIPEGLRQAEYNIGALTLGVTHSSADRDNHAFGGTGVTAATGALDDSTITLTRVNSDVEETALVLGASYATGGGLTTWIECMDLGQEHTNNTHVITTTGGAAVGETNMTKTANDDSLFLIGVTLGF